MEKRRKTILFVCAILLVIGSSYASDENTTVYIAKQCENNIVIWNYKSGEVETIHFPELNGIERIKASQDGKMLYFDSRERTTNTCDLIAYDLIKGSYKKISLNDYGIIRVSDIEINKDELWVSAQWDERPTTGGVNGISYIVIIDLKKFEVTDIIESDTYFASLAFSKDNKKAYISTFLIYHGGGAFTHNNEVLVYSVKTRNLLLSIPVGVEGFDCLGDITEGTKDNIIVACRRSGRLAVIDTKKDVLLFEGQVPPFSSYYDLGYITSSQRYNYLFVASSGAPEIGVFDLETLTYIQGIPLASNYDWNISGSVDNKEEYVIQYGNYWNEWPAPHYNRIELYDIETLSFSGIELDFGQGNTMHCYGNLSVASKKK